VALRSGCLWTARFYAARLAPDLRGAGLEIELAPKCDWSVIF